MSPGKETRNALTVKARNSRVANMKLKLDVSHAGSAKIVRLLSVCYTQTRCFTDNPKIPLQKWFLAISLIANAKKSISSYQLQRDLSLKQKTAWFMQVRIRAEMATKANTLLKGIIEADETYIGGTPRKENKKEDREPANRIARIKQSLSEQLNVEGTLSHNSQRTSRDRLSLSLSVVSSISRRPNSWPTNTTPTTLLAKKWSIMLSIINSSMSTLIRTQTRLTDFGRS